MSKNNKENIYNLFWIKVIYPYLTKIIKSIDYNFGKKVAVVLTMFLLFDIGLTGYAIHRAREKSVGIKPSNRVEEELDKTFNEKYLTNMYNNNWGD